MQKHFPHREVLIYFNCGALTGFLRGKPLKRGPRRPIICAKRNVNMI